MPGPDPQAQLTELDAVTRRLRRECPWDREQDERSIVPHTVEEAYELADAAYSGDDAKLLDELGDVLFQVFFLSLLLEERGAGSLAGVATSITEKLLRRHPHVFGDTEVSGTDEVKANWDAIKRGEEGRDPGLFGDVPENLPALLYARKLQRRVAARGFDVAGTEGSLSAIAAICEAGAEPSFEELGDLLFAAVNVARKLDVDPELALRGSAQRFRERVEAAAARAARHGENFDEISPERRLEYYVHQGGST